MLITFTFYIFLYIFFKGMCSLLGAEKIALGPDLFKENVQEEKHNTAEGRESLNCLKTLDSLL